MIVTVSLMAESRSVIQIVSAADPTGKTVIIALCNDGTMWKSFWSETYEYSGMQAHYGHELKWEPIANVPQPR